MKRILVFVVRHGERADEVPSQKSCYKRTATKEDRYDPKLTPEGHWQAVRAFQNVVGALECAKLQRVAVFTSPLRRAIGTSMMLSVAAATREGREGEKTGLADDGDTNENTGLRFVLPTKSSEADNSTAPAHIESSNLLSTIPIVVMNGLSDCTGLVSRMGGHRNLIRANVMPCASMPENSMDHPDNHKLRSKLKDIQATALEHDNVSTAAIASCASTQYWKIEARPNEEQRWQERSSFVPMAPPLTLDETQESTADGTNLNEQFSSRRPTPASYHANERDSSIDEAVRMALEADCDACIVSSHREEIRELYKNRCRYRHSRISIPYCCIGVFEVMVDKDDTNDPTPPLQWIMHDVMAPDQLLPERVACIVSSWRKVDVSMTTESFPITYPVIERTTLHLCEATLILDDTANTKSITGIRSLKVTGIHVSKQRKAEDVTNNTSFPLNLQVVKGHHSWLQFLQRIGEDVAHGSVELIMNENEGTPQHHHVRIHPENQDSLPCPPTSIRIEVVI